MVSAAQGQQDTHFMVVACVSIFLFDFLQTLPAEWRLYWNRGWQGLKSPVVLIFLAVRYFTLLNAILSIYVNASPLNAFGLCVALVRVPNVCNIIANYATNCLFTLRVYALSNRNKYIGIGLLILSAAQIPPGIAFQFGLHAAHIPNQDGCSFSSTNLVAMPIFFGMGLLFDLVAFTLTAYYLLNGFQRLGFWTPVAKALLEDGLIYMLIAGTIQVVQIISLEGFSKTSHIRGVTGPLVFIVAVLAQRITLRHLGDFAIRGVVRSKFNESSAPGSGYQSRQGLRSKSSYAPSAGYGASTQQTSISLSSPPPSQGQFPQHQYHGQQPQYQQHQHGPYAQSYRSNEKDMYELA